MAIDYASKYSPIVDEAFTLGSLTGGFISDQYDWIGVETVKVYSIPTVSMNNYSLTGTSRYGTPSELQNNAQELKIKKDRSFTFTIDRKSYDDTMFTMEAGKALGRQINEVVIPEVDKYRITKIVANAKSANVVTASTTTSTAYAAFLAVQEILDDAKVPVGGRRCLVTPGFLNKIKQDDAFTKKGDMATKMAINGLVGEIDGVAIVKAPTSYFPTNVDFVIVNPVAVVGPIKLETYKIHTDAPGINGALVEGRIRYDAFVLNAKADAIGVHRSAAPTYSAVTPTGTENPSAEGWYTKSGDVYTLTTDETVVNGTTYYAQN